MFASLLAQSAGFWNRSWGFVEFLIFVVIVAACAGIMFIALRVFGVALPGWLVQIFWICVAACVAIMAIRFVASL